MDGESVRSGRSENSERSRRSKRVQRLTNTSLNPSPYVYHGQLKNDMIVQNANASSQPLLMDQNMQIFDASINHSAHNQMLPNIQPTHLNGFPSQHIAYSQQYQFGSQVYNTESWSSSNMLPNTNYSTCSQRNTYGPHNQGWVGQQFQQAYTQFIPPSMTNQFVRPPINLAPLNQVTQQQQQQQIQPQQPGLTNTCFTNCQPPSEQVTQFSTSLKPERFDNTHDENAWVEEVTAVTGATSETGLSGGDNFSRVGARYDLAASLGVFNNSSGNGFGLSGAATALIRSEADNVKLFKCSHIISMLISIFLSISSLISPILMLIFPTLPFWIGWSTNTCESDCEGHLISISVKLVLLSIALWYLGTPCRPFCCTNGVTAILPRIRLCRTLFLCLVMIILFAFWLFYAVRIIQPKESNYFSIVLYASSLTDTLLFLHYAGIAFMELRRARFRFAVHVVRSPDGASKTFKCGDMSLQRAALEVLQFYMVEFPAYNPNQNQSSGNGSKRNRRAGSAAAGTAVINGGTSKYKFYDVDGTNTELGKSQDNGVAYTVDPNRGPAPSASARLFEEIEVDKRIRKRRMRLLLAVEEAFSHVKSLSKRNGSVATDTNQLTLPFDNCRANGRLDKHNCLSNKSLDPYEAAQAIFPTLIKPLQKYMRVTRQQARHPVDMVIDHLALCLAYGLSPLAFLERFNLLVATPQHDAAAAASVILNAKRAKKHFKQQQQQQQQQQSKSNHSKVDTDLVIPKHVFPGGQQIWSIVADRALSRSLVDGIVFQLRRNGEVSLLCTVRLLPLICLIDEVVQPIEAGRFALRTDNAV